MRILMFVQGRRYKRKELHDRFGGQRQGGISTPKNAPLLMLFTWESGREFGYQDGWTDEGVFEYTGEGQRGDMEATRGNAAILNHAKQGRDLHVFEAAGRGSVRYVGQMMCVGFHEREGPDVDGRDRRALVFDLVPKEASAQPPYDEEKQELGELWTLPMNELRERARGEVESKPASHRHGTRALYERSEAVRVYVLRRAGGVCEACEAKAPFTAADGRPYLEPHHIRRLSDGGPDDPAWVAGVCPNCHRHAHYGHDAREFNSHLAVKVQRMETR